MKCRHCKNDSNQTFLNLGFAPPSNSYISQDELHRSSRFLPLRLFVCPSCWLVQTDDTVEREVFFSAEYAYFSSFSSTWVSHAAQFVNDVTQRFSLDGGSLVVELAANDGYLLQHVKEKGIPSLGIEPTASTAQVARQKGLEILEEFFGDQLARQLVQEGRSADLVVANNVLAHVPDINDFARGVASLLKPNGVATFEFHHLLKLVQGVQFDSAYHEHYSYLSLLATERILDTCGLKVFDAEKISTHGGSLRVFAQRADSGTHPIESRVAAVLAEEKNAGMDALPFYEGFQAKADAIKNGLLRFLIHAKESGKKVGAYGAAAKGNTLLNYAGVRPDLLPWVVDRNPAKAGKFMPGSCVPIVSEDRIDLDRPDYVLIFPWNLKSEVQEQLQRIRSWGGRFVVAIPELRIE